MKRPKNPSVRPRRLAAVLVLTLATVTVGAQPPTIGDFFDRFTADWIRSNPDQAVSTRYFSGEEQRALERRVVATWPDGASPSWPVSIYRASTRPIDCRRS
jgi:hypothetical protein